MSSTPKDDDWWINEDIEQYDWRQSPLTNAFVDALLLAFIRAHPLQKTKAGLDEKQRLKNAREALFGLAPAGHLRTKHDVPELLMMARLYLADRGGIEEFDEDGNPVWAPHDPNKCRSHEELAALAIKEKYRLGAPKEIAAPTNVEDRLCGKFEEQMQELLLSAHYVGDAEFLVELLTDIRRLLGRTQIPMKLPEDPMRDLKRPI